MVIPETKRLVEGSAGGVAGVAAVIGGGMKVEVENSRLKLRGAAAATLIAILGFGLGGLTLSIFVISGTSRTTITILGFYF